MFSIRHNGLLPIFETVLATLIAIAVNLGPVTAFAIEYAKISKWVIEKTEDEGIEACVFYPKESLANWYIQYTKDGTLQLVVSFATVADDQGDKPFPLFFSFDSNEPIELTGSIWGYDGRYYADLPSAEKFFDMMSAAQVMGMGHPRFGSISIRLNDINEVIRALVTCHSSQTVASNDSVADAGDVTLPKPGDYPAEDFLHGKTRLPDFKKRDREFNSYRTRIQDGMREGPNFAGHYSIVQFGCGTECTLVVIGDNKTGRPFWFMRGGDDNLALQLRYRLESRLLAAQWASSELDKCFVELFDFENDEWKLLKKLEIGTRQDCYTDISATIRW